MLEVVAPSIIINTYDILNKSETTPLSHFLYFSQDVACSKVILSIRYNSFNSAKTNRTILHCKCNNR